MSLTVATDRPAAADPLVEAVASRLAPTLAKAVAELVAADHRLTHRALLMSVAEAADAMSVSQNTIHDLIAAGDLEYVDGIGRGRKVVVESLAAWVDGHRTRKAAA